MASNSEWYDEGAARNQRDELRKWARVSTVLQPSEIPGYEEKTPLSVSTHWEEGPWRVSTTVVAGMVGRVVLADKNLDGSDRAALEDEHRRIVDLIRQQGTGGVQWA